LRDHHGLAASKSPLPPGEKDYKEIALVQPTSVEKVASRQPMKRKTHDHVFNAIQVLQNEG
jgi:hypothetical protein